jgi:hypothetical protein
VFSSNSLRLTVFAVGASVAFGVLVTSNAGGYRFGVSDQAFYIPAIQRDISPELFPDGAALIESQSKLMATDEIVATIAVATGAGLELLFFAGYVLTVLVFAAGTTLIGVRLYRSPWSLAALGLGLTLRHRIAETGVNTFEGYFHPRVLAFAIGLAALGAVLHRQRLFAVTLVAVAFLAHPTTAGWFAVCIATALVVAREDPGLGWFGTGLAVAIAAIVAVIVGGPLSSSLVVMDPSWTAVLVEKDYLFPSDWDAATWLVNLVAPGVLAAVYVARRRAGLVSREERGVVAGCAVLLLLFAASLPLIDARVALAVQLQTSRVLWLVDFVATAYLVWAIAEAPWRWPSVAPAVRAAALVAIVAAASLARGTYSLWIEHDRPLVRVDLPATAWQEIGDWASTHTTPDAHFLADPGHAWKYGVSFRVAADRDVFVEGVKDAAIATYSRDIAEEVLGRLRAVGDFATLTSEDAERLAREYDLDYLVIDRPLALPLVYGNDMFRVYALGDDRPTPAGPLP